MSASGQLRLAPVGRPLDPYLLTDHGLQLALDVGNLGKELKCFFFLILIKYRF